MKKQFKGKAIYQPAGKAAEYAKWACNFYVGCSNGCEYCYCKKGILEPVMGMDKPQLKKCFKDEDDAIRIFIKEFRENIDGVKKHGLFFSFTTDPMLSETIKLTGRALNFCQLPFEEPIPVKILTKCAWWVDQFLAGKDHIFGIDHPDKIAFGFTLTGHNELEPGASSNQERIEAMKKLHESRFRTFASIEPIVDFESSFKMICDTNGFCDLYKIGLESGKKYDEKELIQFMNGVVNQVEFFGAKIYFKDSLLKAAGLDRSELPSNCVSRDFNIFNQ